MPDEYPTSGSRVTRTVGILPDDLYDYYGPEPKRRRVPVPAGRAKTWRVTDDYIQGISTRSVDELVKAMGMSGISKS